MSTELEGNENTSDDGGLNQPNILLPSDERHPLVRKYGTMASCAARCAATLLHGRRDQYIRAVSAPYRHVEMSTLATPFPPQMTT